MTRHSKFPHTPHHHHDKASAPIRQNKKTFLVNLAVLSTVLTFSSLASATYPPSWAPGLADKDCTVKDICPHVDETEGNRQRPPSSVMGKIKRQEEQDHLEVDCTKEHGGCELDHVIPIALCGATSDIQNLALEPAEPKPGYHEKDWVEEDLHRKVCAGTIDLETAQDVVVNHWESYYDQNHGQD